MRLGSYLRIRGRRGWGISRLGPNEARVLFDLLLGLGAAIAALVFLRTFFPTSSAPFLTTLVFLPGALIAGNAAFGIYSYLKLASPGRKALALAGSHATTAVLGWLVGAPLVVIALWSLLTLPTAIIARMLLGLPYSRRVPLQTLAVTRHGPVLVIGGAGYIGSLTVERLLQRGHRVRVLDRLMYGSHPLSAFVGSANFELIEGDVTDISKLTAAMRHASAVIHLAGLVGDPACAVDPDFTRHANIVATRMAKEVAQSLGIHRFIFASSCSVYGASDDEVREGDALNPVSLYARDQNRQRAGAAVSRCPTTSS